jgi:hypothetical protein
MHTIDATLLGWSRRKSYAMIRKPHIAPDNIQYPTVAPESGSSDLERRATTAVTAPRRYPAQDEGCWPARMWTQSYVESH